MIFYFSGTGNSREIAERLAEGTNDQTTCVSFTKSYPTTDDNLVGFVFPVYAWGIPRIMIRFIQELQFNKLPTYLYMVCTCGDDIGYTHKDFQRLIKKKHANVDAAWSVIMPNTYVNLPGFDIDAQDVAFEKIQQAQIRVTEITEKINRREHNIIDVKSGDFPWLKSYVLRPLFNSLLTGDRKFTVTDQCTHCGLCAKSCPVSNITYGKDEKPIWLGQCADCMTCYHSCPVHAIKFGPFTKHKGQYLYRRFIKQFQSR